MKLAFILIIVLVTQVVLYADNDVDMGEEYYKRVVEQYIEQLKNDKAAFETKLQGFFDDTSQQLGFGLSYHAASPAQNLKFDNMPTIDAGVELSLLKVDTSNEMWQYIIVDENIPPVLLLPRLHVNMGLPAKFEIGASGAKIPYSNIWLIGGEVKWSIIGNYKSTFNLAIRGAFSKLIGIEQLSISSIEGNISGSFDFAVILPYFGIGAVDIMADATVPNVPVGFASDVADRLEKTGQERAVMIDTINNVFPEGTPFFDLKKYNHVVPKIFLGAKFDLMFVNFTTELAFSYDVTKNQYINTFFTLRANLSF